METSQTEEFEQAEKKGRQPCCIYCNQLLDEVRENQGIELIWTWNKKKKRYVKSEVDGWSDKPFCGNCEAKDWDFTNNNWIKY